MPDEPTYTQGYKLEDDRARISGHVSRGQNDAWFRPAAVLQSQPAFEIRFFAIGAPITIRFRALRRLPQSQRIVRLAAPAPGEGREPVLPSGGTVVHMRPLPFERPGAFGEIFDPIDPLPPLPPIPPEPPADSDHAPCTIRLFPPGSDEPAQVWNLEGGRTTRTQEVEFAPHLPLPGSPATQAGWWRCTLTVTGDDPASVWLRSSSVIGFARFQTRTISKRLLDRMLGVVLAALTPDVRARGSEVSIRLGEELASLYDIDAVALIHTIDPGVSNAKLRTFSVKFVSGQDMIDAVRELEDRAEERLNAVPSGSGSDLVRALLQQLLNRAKERRQALEARVQPDYIALKIKAAFQDATVRAHGFDIGSLENDMGEIFIAFDYTFTFLVPLIFVVFNYTWVGEIAELFGLTPIDDEDIDDLIHQKLVTHQQEINRYLREALGRMVARRGRVFNARAIAGGWEIRYYEDLPEPDPSDPIRVPSPVDGLAVLDPAVLVQPAAGIGPPPEGPPGDPPEEPPSDVDPWPQEFVVAGGVALDRLDQIGTLVVIMMENRSFDHLLGDLAQARPRSNDAYDSLPTDASNPAAGGFADRIPAIHAAKIGLDTAIGVSPHHGFAHIGFQIGGGDHETSGSGAMEGFTRDIMDRTDAPQIVMSYYRENELPTYYRLADEFMVCDRWFCAHPGPTFPNRWATLNGTIPEIDNLAIEDPRFGFLEGELIFGVLDRHRIDWRYYESDVSMIRMFDRYRLDDNKVLAIDDPDDGLEALLRTQGPLPRVIFVEPDFADVPPVSMASDDHPPADLARGQAFIARICNLLWTSGRWDELTLLITYDEHGGFFDHVAPPGTPLGDPDWIDKVPKIHPEGADFMGPRVPTFLVSPYVAAGSISHQVFDHTSIIKTILVHNRDNLTRDAFTSLGPRVNAAAHLGVALELDSPRPSPLPFGVAGSETPVGPFGPVVAADLATRRVAVTPSTAPSLTPRPAAPPLAERPLAQPSTTATTSDESGDGVVPVPTAPPTVSIEAEGWDEIPPDPGDFHTALRRAMAPRRKR